MEIAYLNYIISLFKTALDHIHASEVILTVGRSRTVEMFLKTLELISTFHPNLSSGQLLVVERKMAITKKFPFEKWVTKSFAKKARLLENEKRKFQRERFFRSWREWFSLANTQQAILPLIVTIFISSFVTIFIFLLLSLINFLNVSIS